MLFPGTSPNSDTVKALMKASSEAAALNSRTSGGWAVAWVSATDMATNSRPVRVAAAVAMVTKRSL